MATTKSKPNLAAMPAAPDDWQAQDDLHTLMRAHEIKSDPKRHGKAQAMAQKRLAATQAIISTKKA